jgi:hypothetical protein
MHSYNAPVAFSTSEASVEDLGEFPFRSSLAHQLQGRFYGEVY